MAEPHLPSLTIEGFRGFKKLDLRKLGHVNLLVGKNGVGKSSVLDAVRLYSSHASFETLGALLFERGDPRGPYDPDAFSTLLPLSNTLEPLPLAPPIRVGPIAEPISISVRWTTTTVEPDGTTRVRFHEGVVSPSVDRGIAIVVESPTERIRYAPLVRRNGPWSGEYIDLPQRRPNPTYRFVSSHGLDYAAVGKYWDSITLTEWEDEMHRVLSLFDSRVLKFSLQGEGGSRRVMARLKDLVRPVPLSFLGEGATRFFGIALAMTNCQNGFLLIDEFENGLHYTAQEKLWRFIVRAAKELNVQVFATTHSNDCLEAFSKAANEATDVEGVVSRLVEVDGVLHVAQYDERLIDFVTREMVEIR